MNPKLGQWLLAAGIAALPSIAVAAETLPPVDHFSFSFGAYRAGNDVDMRWDRSDGSSQGTRLDVKPDLGIDLDGTEPTFEIGASFGHGRHGHRHRLEAFRYGYDDSASKVLTGTYRIGDEVFVEDADLDGRMEVKLLGLSYTWFFHHDGHSAFGVGLGAIRYDVSAALAATAETGEGIQTASAAFSEAEWVPQLHAEYVKSLSHRWRVGVDASYVKKSGGSFSGKAVDLGVKAEYFPWQHFGLGLRYNFNDISLDIERHSFTGGIDIRTHGPQLVGTLRF